MKEHGEDWDDRPVCRTIFFTLSGNSLQADSKNDMLMLLMIKTQKVGMSLDGLARRLLFVNFAGIFSASMASDHILSPPYDAILNIACQ